MIKENTDLNLLRPVGIMKNYWNDLQTDFAFSRERIPRKIMQTVSLVVLAHCAVVGYGWNLLWFIVQWWGMAEIYCVLSFVHFSKLFILDYKMVSLDNIILYVTADVTFISNCFVFVCSTIPRKVWNNFRAWFLQRHTKTNICILLSSCQQFLSSLLPIFKNKREEHFAFITSNGHYQLKNYVFYDIPTDDTSV